MRRQPQLLQFHVVFDGKTMRLQHFVQLTEIATAEKDHLGFSVRFDFLTNTGAFWLTKILKTECFSLTQVTYLPRKNGPLNKSKARRNFFLTTTR